MPDTNLLIRIEKAMGTNYEYDVFISYSSKDADWVRNTLLPRLENANLNVCIDKDDFPIGQVFTKTIEKAVEQSRYVLIIMTSDYFQSKWTQYEVSLILTGDPMGENQKIVPLLLKPCEMPLSVRRYTYGDFQNPDEKAWGKLLSQLCIIKTDAHTVLETPLPVKNEGLTALTEPELKQALQTAISYFKTSFNEASERSNLLSRYKYMHDLFQQLEDECRQLYVFGKYLGEMEESWEDIERIEPKLEPIIEELNSIACAPPFTSGNFLWVVKLDRVGGEVRSAVEQRDVSQFNAATRRIQELLNREPSRINTRLVETARTLPLTIVLKALFEVRDSLPSLVSGSAADRQSQEFGRGIDDLDQLNQKLKFLVGVHDTLQEIDNELKRADALLVNGHDEINELWNDLHPNLKAICDDCAEDWAVKLAKAGAELQNVLAAASPPPQIKRLFRAFQSQANRSFNQVDGSLLKLCVELESFNKQISSLLRMT